MHPFHSNPYDYGFLWIFAFLLITALTIATCAREQQTLAQKSFPIVEMQKTWNTF